MKEKASSLLRFLGSSVLLVVAILSVLTSYVLFEQLLSQGLNILGWLALLLSVSVLSLFLFRTFTEVDGERAEYLDVVCNTQLIRDPVNFIASAKDKATEFYKLLDLSGEENVEISPDSLPIATKFLQQKGEKIKDEPELVCLAAAYFGEILRTKLEGEWRVWRKLRYKDPVIRLGKRLTTHDVSPGMLVLRVAEEPKATLEDIVRHEEYEMSLGARPGR